MADAGKVAEAPSIPTLAGLPDDALLMEYDWGVPVALFKAESGRFMLASFFRSNGSGRFTNCGLPFDKDKGMRSEADFRSAVNALKPGSFSGPLSREDFMRLIAESHAPS